MKADTKATAADATPAGDAGSAGGAAEADAAEKRYPKGYTPPKGRPTPKRVEQEIKRGVVRDPNALSPAQAAQREKELKKSMTKEEWREHKKQRRQENRETNKKIQARIDAGDERYLQERDRGEVRAYVRDWVDGRRFFNNFMMPLALVLLLIMFIGVWFPSVAAALSTISMVFILVIFAEGISIGVRANRAVREKFPDTTETGFGLGMYAFSRGGQPRNWRSPKPRVPVGTKV